MLCDRLLFMFLRLKPYIAPKRFVFKDPDTGYFYQAFTRPELIKRIVNYRAQNNLEPLEQLDHVLEHFWCTDCKENTGNCEPNPAFNPKNKEFKRSLLAYFKGGIALLKNVFYGEANMVSQEVADERAVICRECPHNIVPVKGPMLKWSDEIAEASTGGRKSKYHDELGSCEVCSCPLRAKVFYKGDFGLSAEEKSKMSKLPKCWQVNKYG